MVYATSGSPGFHKCDFDYLIEQTHLGQAHFAGTGPTGKTCRECSKWGLMTKAGVVHPGYTVKPEDGAHPIKQARCHHPMPHKARRRFPHDALACRLFEQSDNPPEVVKDNG